MTIADATSNVLSNPKDAAAPGNLKVTAVALPARIQKAESDLSIYYGDWINADKTADLAELMITRADDTHVDVAGNFLNKQQIRAAGAWDDNAKALAVTFLTDPGSSGPGITRPGTSHALAIKKGNDSATELTVIDSHGSELSTESSSTFQPKTPR
jgi:hypothetical protein